MRIILSVLVLAFVASPAWAQAKKQPTPQPLPAFPAPAPPPPIGRYVAIQPPAGTSNSAYTNFLWVLDTATGVINAYRVASYDEDGKHAGFLVEKLESTAEYYVRLLNRPPQPK